MASMPSLIQFLRYQRAAFMAPLGWLQLLCFSKLEPGISLFRFIPDHQVAFATFFLNRTNRSGILSAGVIGGKEQKGDCKLDARFNKEDLCERIRRIGRMRQHISVYGLDAMDLIDMIKDEFPSNSLTYFDPPYYEKGSQLYRNFYKPEDHAQIAEKVSGLQKPWLVTYDNCAPIKALYSKTNSVEFSLCYSTHKARPKATEAMFYGNLNLHESPYMTKRD